MVIISNPKNSLSLLITSSSSSRIPSNIPLFPQDLSIN
nr:MAG TPA: hypothetical protein [Caudoviricetes sp.]